MKNSKAVLVTYQLTTVHQHLKKKTPKNPTAAQDFISAVGWEQKGGQGATCCALEGAPCLGTLPLASQRRAGAERARAGKLRAGNELHPPQDSWDGAERSCPSQKQRAAELLSGF